MRFTIEEFQELLDAAGDVEPSVWARAAVLRAARAELRRAGK